MYNVYLTSRVAKSAVKQSAAYKLNQHINGKEGKGEKRNNSRIALNRRTCTKRADIYTCFLKEN